MVCESFQVWGQYSTLNCAVYSEKRHLKITLRSVIPSSALRNGQLAVQSWVTDFLRDFVKDVKHSGKWLCAHCGEPAMYLYIRRLIWLLGKPARELQFDIMSYLHLPKPMLAVYVRLHNTFHIPTAA